MSNARIFEVILKTHHIDEVHTGEKVCCLGERVGHKLILLFAGPSCGAQCSFGDSKTEEGGDSLRYRTPLRFAERMETLSLVLIKVDPSNDIVILLRARKRLV